MSSRIAPGFNRTGIFLNGKRAKRCLRTRPGVAKTSCASRARQHSKAASRLPSVLRQNGTRRASGRDPADTLRVSTAKLVEGRGPGAGGAPPFLLYCYFSFLRVF